MLQVNPTLFLLKARFPFLQKQKNLTFEQVLSSDSVSQYI